MATRGYPELAEQFAGFTFGNGLYRFHDADSGPTALCLIEEQFPELAGRVSPFAFDWLGRAFAVDSGRLIGADPAVLLVEPGTGEALEIPRTFVQFHEIELVDEPEAALAESFFVEWRRAHPSEATLSRTDCVGYRVPLFLGGSDTVENLEVVDLEVYWTILGQLRRGTRRLRPGSTVNGIAAG